MTTDPVRLLRAPGEQKRSVYGVCDSCHRIKAIDVVRGHLPNGQAYGLCRRCSGNATKEEG